MGDPRQATDTEVMDWTVAQYLDDYGEDVAVTNLEDVDRLVGQAAGQVHEHSAVHLITAIAVWPDLTEAEALITVDLPSGIRLCTLCISHNHLILHHTQATSAATVIHHVLSKVLSAARALVGEYETEVSRRIAREPGVPAAGDGADEPDTPRTTTATAAGPPGGRRSCGMHPPGAARVSAAEARYHAAQARHAQPRRSPATSSAG